MGQQIYDDNKILEEINKDTYKFLFYLVVRKPNYLAKDNNFKFDEKFVSLYLYNDDKQDFCITCLVNPYDGSGAIKKKII